MTHAASEDRQAPLPQMPDRPVAQLGLKLRRQRDALLGAVADDPRAIAAGEGLCQHDDTVVLAEDVAVFGIEVKEVVAVDIRRLRSWSVERT